jgi:hypothetical protein
VKRVLPEGHHAVKFMAVYDNGTNSHSVRALMNDSCCKQTISLLLPHLKVACSILLCPWFWLALELCGVVWPENYTGWIQATKEKPKMTPYDAGGSRES